GPSSAEPPRLPSRHARGYGLLRQSQRSGDRRGEPHVAPSLGWGRGDVPPADEEVAQVSPSVRERHPTPSLWTCRLLSHVARVPCRPTSGTRSLDGSADPGRPRTLLSVLMRTLNLETTREVG